MPVTGIGAKGAQSLRHFPAGTVAECQNEGHGGVARGGFDTLHEFVARLFGYACGVADGLQADVVVHKGLGLVAHGFDEEFHEAVDFLLRTVPVLGAEGVKGQVFDTAGHSGLHGLADGGHGVLVAEDALVGFCRGLRVSYYRFVSMLDDYCSHTLPRIQPKSISAEKEKVTLKKEYQSLRESSPRLMPGALT